MKISVSGWPEWTEKWSKVLTAEQQCSAYWSLPLVLRSWSCCQWQPLLECSLAVISGVYFPYTYIFFVEGSPCWRCGRDREEFSYLTFFYTEVSCLPVCSVISLFSIEVIQIQDVLVNLDSRQISTTNRAEQGHAVSLAQTAAGSSQSGSPDPFFLGACRSF